MTCEEVERKVPVYIRDGLYDDELEAFIEHVKNCPDCHEELEINFMVDLGLKQLDEGKGTFDIIGAMERRLDESSRRIKLMWLGRKFRYSINTIGGMAVLLCILMQIRIWFF